mmetsp:Transcript_27651/g.39545  ORF Transcript_27651/g.39545 Transcript_27651/m.39545 type:complete len:182 (-) Transcript_27651:42-587(-)
MAEDRKARLAALASKAANKSAPRIEKDTGNNNEKNSSDDIADKMEIAATEEPTTIKFRNYIPQSKELSVGAGTLLLENDMQTTKDTATVSKRRRIEDDVEKDAELSLEKALESAKLELLTSPTANNEISALAPKKVNWDLKRDLQPKLDKLERRTQRAIVELLHQRLEREAAEEVEEDDLD